MGARDGSGPDGQLVHPQERPRFRDDRRAQRVRERREQPAARAVRADARLRVPVAQLRQHRRSARAPTSRTSTSAACRRSTSCTTSRTTRCSSSPASSTPTPTLALIAKYFGPIPKPDAHAAAHLHAGSGAGRRAQRDAAPRRQLASSSASCITSRAARIPDFVAADVLGDVLTLAPFRPAVQGAGRHQEGVLGSSWARCHDGSRHAHVLGRRCRTASRSSRCATRCSRPIANIAKEPITEARGRARARAKPRSTSTTVINDPQAFGVAISESIALGDWRLFFIQRDHYRAVTPADVQRVALAYFKRSNVTLGEFMPDRQAGPRADAADRRHRGA